MRDGPVVLDVIGLLVRATVKHKRLPLPPMSMWLIGFTILVLIELLNPEDGSLYHSLAGVRQDLEFIPLFFLTFAFVRSTHSLRVFVVLLAVIAAANGAANVAQFRESPQQLAELGPGVRGARPRHEPVLSGGVRAFYSGGQQHTRPCLMGDAGTRGVVCALALGAILADVPAQPATVPVLAASRGRSPWPAPDLTRPGGRSGLGRRTAGIRFAERDHRRGVATALPRVPWSASRSWWWR